MLSARRKSDNQIVSAYFESKRNGPFFCTVCGDEVILRTGRSAVSHFAHANPLACRYAEGESDAHRRCKLEIFKGLRESPDASDVALERPFGTNRADVFARIRGVPVAIEVQISSLPVEAIMRRTIDYHRQGIYVLWLLPWTPKLDADRYAPKPWEKWLHAAYFGRVYYWKRGLEIVSYSFEPSLKTVPRKVWHDAKGRRIVTGGYSRRSKRHRTAIRGETLNLASDFVPRNRDWWEGGGVKVPDAKIFMGRN